MSRRTRDQITQVVFHDSVTTSVHRTIDVLERRGLDVHRIIGPDGSWKFRQKYTVRLAHAGPLNAKSVALEVVNPYYPKHLPEDRGPLDWGPVVDVPWAHRGSTVLPGIAQVCTAYWMLTKIWAEYAVPEVWVGEQEPGVFTMGRLPKVDTDTPGIWAHAHDAHADGLFIALVTAMIHHGGYESAGHAYFAAVQLVKDGGRRIEFMADQFQGGLSII